MEFSFLSPQEVEKLWVVWGDLLLEQKDKQQNQQQRENRTFEAEGKGLDKAVCLCVKGTADGQKNKCLYLSQVHREVH